MKLQKALTTTFVLFTFLAITLTACAPTPEATAPTSTTAHTPTFPPTYTAAPPATLVPTFTLTPLPEASYLYNWPIPAPTDAQIQAAIDCENRNWGKAANFDPASYKVSFPASACEYAMQAISTVESIDLMTLVGEGYTTAQQALTENPWLIISDPVFFNAFHTFGIVAPPPFAHSKLESAIIAYSWTGDNNPVSFEIEITTDGPVTATGLYQKIITTGEGDEAESVVQSRKINKEIKSQDFVNLGKSLENLIPIPQQTPLNLCENHHPDWIVTLTYTTGTEITLQSNQSTYLVYMGGPFQTNIDGQDYLLATASFNTAIYELTRQLAIELGNPEEAGCTNIRIAETLLGAQP